MWIDRNGVEKKPGEWYEAPNGTRYPPQFPPEEIEWLTWAADPPPEPKTAEEIAAELASAKEAKNRLINQWRMTANQTSFTHLGKTIACDALSRADIDAVAGSIALTDAFPAGFPNAWKATDNSYLMLPDVAAFKSMYASMTLQGTINFGHSQALKAALAAATTIEQVEAITW